MIELYAAIVGRAERKRSFMFHLDRGDGDVELIYPFWILPSASGRVTLIDTGFGAAIAAERGVREHVEPAAALARLGIAPGDVDRVIVSHLHYDHFSGPERFPNATFAVQRADVDYYVERSRDHPARSLADIASVERIPDLIAAGRVDVLDGDTRLMPGIDLVHVGGHTPGMQIVVCDDGDGPIVLACDAAHFYANQRTRTPTTLIYAYEAYVDGFDRIAAAARDGRWFPGHDPAMLAELAPVADGLYRVPVSAR